MKLRNLIILCAVLCILAGLVLVKQKTRRDAPSVDEEQDMILSPLTLEGITEAVFRFGESGKEVRIIKEADGWKIQSLYGVDAEKSVLERFLKQLDGLKGELRSDDASLFADYGIAEGEGVHIILGKDAAPVAHLVVGFKRFGADGNFVRHQGQNKVYAVEENILLEFGMWGEIRVDGFDVKRWFDSRVARFDVEQAAGFRVGEGGTGGELVWLDLTRMEADGQKKWESASAYAFGLSVTKIRNFFRNLGGIRARDVVSVEEAQEAFAGRFWRAQISLAEGNEIAVTRGAKTEGGQDYYVKVSDQYCFLVPVSVFDNWTRGLGDIFISNPLKIETETIDKFEVKDLAAKKKFSMSRSAEKTDSGERVVWQTAAGGEIEESKAKDIIQKFKGMDIHLAPADTIPAPNALTVKISSFPGTSTIYTLTENKKFDDGRECRFLKVTGDPHAYCYPAAGVEGFQAAIPFKN